MRYILWIWISLNGDCRYERAVIEVHPPVHTLSEQMDSISVITERINISLIGTKKKAPPFYLMENDYGVQLHYKDTEGVLIFISNTKTKEFILITTEPCLNLATE
jgi:hypothetical protein